MSTISDALRKIIADEVCEQIEKRGNTVISKDCLTGIRMEVTHIDCYAASGKLRTNSIRDLLDQKEINIAKIKDKLTDIDILFDSLSHHAKLIMDLTEES